MKNVLSYCIVIFVGIVQLNAQKFFDIHVETNAESVDSSLVEFYIIGFENVKDYQESTFNNTGVFELSNIKQGNYQITIKSLGYSTIIDTVYVDKNISKKYELMPLNEELKEITIIGLKDAIRFEHGDIKADVENSVLANQSSINNLLQQLPKLLLNPSSETVQVVGSGNALLYFDNQRISYQQLQAIPVNVIKYIEIIQNPPAKYEADGQAVIIIHRKRNLINGYNGSISNMNSIRRGYNNHSSLSLNTRKNKWELQTNANYNYQSFWEFFGSSFDLNDNELLVENSGVSKGPRNQFIGGCGLFYSISEKEYISTNIQFTLQNTLAPITTSSEINENNQLISTISDSKANRHFLSGNVNYNRPIVNGELFIGMQFTDYLRGLDDEISNKVGNSAFEIAQIRDQEFKIQSSALRIDYTYPIGKNHSWEIGCSGSNAIADAFTHFDVLDSNSTFIRNYDYSELNLALYTQINGKISKADYTVGLRTEQNRVIGKFREEEDEVINRNKINFFPNATLTIPIDSTKSIRTYYRSSILRPNYLNASSISTFVSPYLEYSRNANLISTLIHRLGISYQYNRTSISVNGFVNYNPTYSIATYNDINQRITLSPENLERETGINLDYSTSINYKSWNTSLFLRGTYSSISDSRFEIDAAKPYFYFNINQRYLLPFTKPKLTIGSVFWGLTPQKKNIITRKGMYSLGLNVQASFDKKWIVSLHAHDILNKIQYADQYSVNKIIVDSKFLANSRGIELMVRYNFGGQWKSIYKNQNVDDNLDRI